MGEKDSPRAVHHRFADDPGAYARLGEDPSEYTMFGPALLLDPLRVVHGAEDRYDCRDLAALDRHIGHLRRRIADLGGRVPAADRYRVDTDRLLARRSSLTLPGVADALRR